MNGWTKKSTNERDKRYDNKVEKKKKKKTGVDVVDVGHQVFCKIYYKTSITRYI